jgi:hypothetical protein
MIKDAEKKGVLKKKKDICLVTVQAKEPPFAWTAQP